MHNDIMNSDMNMCSYLNCTCTIRLIITRPNGVTVLLEYINF